MSGAKLGPAAFVATRDARQREGMNIRLRWLIVLATGVALFVAVLWSLLVTQDPVYLPALLLIGGAVVPVTFTTFINDIRMPHHLSAGWIAGGAVLGGVIGAVVAGQLEVETIRELGFMPTISIGLIEESAKLAVPVLVLLFAWHRVRTPDGLLLGVAVGSGFAALETMGYGFVALLQTRGDLAPVTQLLVTRALTEPGGHAAWTGLAAAALFAIRGARRPGLAWLRFLATFAGVVVLHAIWDSTAASHGNLWVGAISLALLLGVTWWLRWQPGSHRRPVLPVAREPVAIARL